MIADSTHKLSVISAKYSHEHKFEYVDTEFNISCFYYARLSDDDCSVVVECVVQDKGEYYVHALDTCMLSDSMNLSAVLCKYGSTLCMSEALYINNKDKIHNSFNELTAYSDDRISLITPRVIQNSENKGVMYNVLEGNVGFFKNTDEDINLEKRKVKFFKWSNRTHISLCDEDKNNIAFNYTNINNFATRNAWHYMAFMNMLHHRGKSYDGNIVFQTQTMSEILVSIIDSFSDLWGHIEEYEDYRFLVNVFSHMFEKHIHAQNAQYERIYDKHCLVLCLLRIMDPNLQLNTEYNFQKKIYDEHEYFRIDTSLMSEHTHELLNIMGHIYKYLYSLYKHDTYQYYLSKIAKHSDTLSIEDNSVVYYVHKAVQDHLTNEFVVSFVIDEQSKHACLYANFIETLCKHTSFNEARIQTFKQYVNRLNETYNPYAHDQHKHTQDSLSSIIYQIFKLCIYTVGYVSILLFYVIPMVIQYILAQIIKWILPERLHVYVFSRLGKYIHI